MGDFNLKYDHAAIHQQTAQIIGVTNLAEASIVAKKLFIEGVDCIELMRCFWKSRS